MKKLPTGLLVLGLIFLFQSPILAQYSEKLFQQGIMKEESEGNLNEAIAIYNKIVNDVSEDRNLRAMALLQVGICYEKLGNQKARKSYQKLIAEFGDQSEIVAIGKEKLKGLNKGNQPKKNGGIIASQVLLSEYNGGRISSDGQSLIYVDWTNNDDKPAINIKDLGTGKTRIVSKVGTWEAPIKFPDNPIWSPDEKQFTYYWYDKVEDKCEFHIANTDGTNDEVIAKGKDALYPLAWSPNGKYILGGIENIEGNSEIVLFSVKDRSSKIIAAPKKNGGRVKKGGAPNFSPDSKYIVYAKQQTENSNENDIYLMSLDGSIDKKIISNIANDTDPQWSIDGKYLVFISDRHGTNDLWKIRIENGLTVGTAKLVKSNLSNLTILGITNNQSLYYESANSRSYIYMFNINIAGSTPIDSAIRISDFKVEKNSNPAISKDGRYIAFIKWQLFSDVGIKGWPFFISIYDTKTGEIKNTNSKTYVLSSLHWYWPKPQWSPDGNNILIQGKKKVNEKLIAGVYAYDIKTQESQPIIGIPDYKGYLETPSSGSGHMFSNDGKSIYYLSTDRKNIRKIDIKSKKEWVIYTHSSQMGQFKLSDDESKVAYLPYNNKHWNELFVVRISDGISKKIVSIKNDDNESLNLIGWDINGSHFYFGDGKFWNINSIMRVSIDGGSPENIINLKDKFPDGRIKGVVFNQNTGTMVIEVSVSSRDMWKLEGVFND